MNLITIDQARAHCKADEDDDDQLTLYANAAEAACARIANRALFADADELASAIASLPATVADATTKHDAAMAAADAMTDWSRRARARYSADLTYDLALDQCEKTEFGIVAEPDIISAVLLLTGHYYRNREAVITGQSASAAMVPEAANAIMERYRRVGPL